MNIKVVAVGSSKWERFIKKWGISFAIGEGILFDTFGDPAIFLRNIEKYKINLDKIKHIIISHNHWDHISGLWSIIGRCKDLNVYICQSFKPDIKERIESLGAKVIELVKPMEITRGIYVTGAVRGEYDKGAVYEQSLVVKDIKGLIVITGCAHPGIITVLDNIRKHFTEQIYLVAGGFHLKDKSHQEIQKIISAFRMYHVEQVAPMHCTGNLAVKLFKKEYKDKFIVAKAGSVIKV